MNPVERAANWAGWPLDDDGMRLLGRYGHWLATEAIAAGGLGPNEKARIEDRHLADSLLFAGGWPHPQPPDSLFDLGSGVGLPGIPLAVIWPGTAVTLMDRSEKRVEMARRAGRMLGLNNLTVCNADIRADVGRADMTVARATGAVADVLRWTAKALKPGGVAVVGGSWVGAPEPVAGDRILTVPPEVLDRPVWLRIMAES